MSMIWLDMEAYLHVRSARLSISSPDLPLDIHVQTKWFRLCKEIILGASRYPEPGEYESCPAAMAHVEVPGSNPAVIMVVHNQVIWTAQWPVVWSAAYDMKGVNIIKKPQSHLKMVGHKYSSGNAIYNSGNCLPQNWTVTVACLCTAVRYT